MVHPTDPLKSVWNVCFLMKFLFIKVIYQGFHTNNKLFSTLIVIRNVSLASYLDHFWKMWHWRLKKNKKNYMFYILYNNIYTTVRWILESDWLTNVLRCAIIFRETHDERSSRQLSWPHYSSVSLCQVISVISKVLQQKNNQNPQRHWPNK